jgi:drug/metabolite transporter (DMT)-like permease
MRRPVAGLSDTTLAALGLLVVTAVWGSTFVLVKDLVARMPVADFLAVRFVLAAVALALLRPRAVGELAAGARRRGVLLGVLYGVAQLLQTAGLQHTPASVSGFITGMYVVFTPLLAGLLLHQRVGLIAWSAVGLATTGLAALSLQGLSIGSGELLTLASAALYALHIIGLGAWSTTRDAYGLSVVQMAAISGICLVAAVPGGLTLPPDAGAWVGVVYMALIAGAFAMVMQTWAQAHLPPTRAAVIMTMEPVWAAAFAVAFGGESLTWRIALGGTLVVAAMYLVELGPRHAADAEVAHISAP